MSTHMVNGRLFVDIIKGYITYCHWMHHGMYALSQVINCFLLQSLYQSYAWSISQFVRILCVIVQIKCKLEQAKCAFCSLFQCQFAAPNCIQLITYNIIVNVPSIRLVSIYHGKQTYLPQQTNIYYNQQTILGTGYTMYKPSR